MPATDAILFSSSRRRRIPASDYDNSSVTLTRILRLQGILQCRFMLLLTQPAQIWQRVTIVQGRVLWEIIGASRQNVFLLCEFETRLLPLLVIWRVFCFRKHGERCDVSETFCNWEKGYANFCILAESPLLDKIFCEPQLIKMFFLTCAVACDDYEAHVTSIIVSRERVRLQEVDTHTYTHQYK